MRPLAMLNNKKTGKASRVSRLYLKLRSKFTLFFFLLVLLPYIAFGLVSYFHIRSVAEQKTFEAALASILHEKSLIDKCIDELKTAISTSVDTLGSKGQNIVKWASSRTYLSSALENAAAASLTREQQQTLSAVYFIDNSGVRASSGDNADRAAISNPSSQQWFYETVKNPAKVNVIGTMQRFYAEGESKLVFSLSAPVSVQGQPDSDDLQAALLFDFDYSLLSDFIAGSVSAENNTSERLIIDSAGNILFSLDQGKLTNPVDESIYDAIDNVEKGFKRVNSSGKNCYMTYLRSSELPWTFITLNPVSEVLDRVWLRSPFMAVCIFALPLILFIYLAISLRLLNPINELTAVISGYEHNQLSGIIGQPSLWHEEPDGTNINDVTDIDFLINKIYTIRLRQKEAELNALQNQINPHFLYNTLESIRGAALYHGIQDIAAMSKALSLLFRYSISQRVLVSIREELQHLENYISIQNFRYENKFQLSYSIPPELMNYKILKLTLQPLIENSIKHGLEMKLGKGTVRIEMLSLDNNIKIQISDDGLGISSKKVEELNRSLSYDIQHSGNEGGMSGTGIGVKNVNARIKLYFGEQYGLKFRDAPAGTVVEIVMPAVEGS